MSNTVVIKLDGLGDDVLLPILRFATLSHLSIFCDSMGVPLETLHFPQYDRTTLQTKAALSVVNKKLQTLSMTFLLESVRLGRQRSIESFLEGIQRPEGGKKGLYVKNLCIAYSEPTNNKPTSLGVVSTKLSRIFLECKRLQVLDMRRFLRNIIGHKLDSAHLELGLMWEHIPTSVEHIAVGMTHHVPFLFSDEDTEGAVVHNGRERLLKFIQDHDKIKTWKFIAVSWGVHYEMLGELCNAAQNLELLSSSSQLGVAALESWGFPNLRTLCVSGPPPLTFWNVVRPSLTIFRLNSFITAEIVNGILSAFPFIEEISYFVRSRDAIKQAWDGIQMDHRQTTTLRMKRIVIFVVDGFILSPWLVKLIIPCTHAHLDRVEDDNEINLEEDSDSDEGQIEEDESTARLTSIATESCRILADELKGMEQLEAFRANGEVVVAFLASDEYTCPAIQNGMTRLLDITFQTPSQFLVSYSICWG